MHVSHRSKSHPKCDELVDMISQEIIFSHRNGKINRKNSLSRKNKPKKLFEVRRAQCANNSQKASDIPHPPATQRKRMSDGRGFMHPSHNHDVMWSGTQLRSCGCRVLRSLGCKRAAATAALPARLLPVASESASAPGTSCSRPSTRSGVPSRSSLTVGAPTTACMHVNLHE